MIVSIGELLLPHTDAGVAMQILGGAAAWVGAMWLVRRHREGRTLVIGVGVLVAALAALRAVH